MTDLVNSPSNFLHFRAKNMLNAITDFIFPPVCGGCGNVGVLFCDSCREQAQCFQTPLQSYSNNPREVPLTTVWTASVFAGSISNFIHKLKYNGQFAMAKPLARLMADVWQEHIEHVPDLVLPIPLHPQREKERGYNQSALIAKPFCQRLKFAYSENGVRRVRHTTSQVTLNAVARKSNLADAFWGEEKAVRGKEILLIDDVFTTGATMLAAANALLVAGARSVSGYCVAHAE